MISELSYSKMMMSGSCEMKFGVILVKCLVRVFVVFKKASFICWSISFSKRCRYLGQSLLGIISLTGVDNFESFLPDYSLLMLSTLEDFDSSLPVIPVSK